MAKGKIDIKPANKGAIFGYLITSLIFLAIGILCFILLWNLDVNGTKVGDEITTFFNSIMSAIISGGTIAQYWWIVLIAVVVLGLLGFLVGWFLLYLVSKLGHILVYAGVVFYIVGALIGGLIMVFTIPGIGFLAALGPMFPAILLIIGIFTNVNKLKRAGEFMKFTGKVILAEKGMIFAPLFVSVVSVINFLTMGSIFAFIAVTFNDTDLAWLGYVLASLASLIQLIVYYGIFYVAEAINTTYAYEWYRKRDPDMRFCVKNVAGSFGPIFLFGVVTAIVSWLQQTLRAAAARTSSKNLAGVIFAIFARILASLMGIIFKYLTYFTLPAIAVEGLKFKDGVSRSFNLLKKYYMDVLIRETGVSRGMSIVQWISFFIYGAIGAILGIAWRFTTGQDWATALLVPIIAMVVFSFIPTFFIFRPMKTAYLTFIFAYAQDEESNFSLPTRMPAELRGDMKEARKDIDPSKSIVNVNY